MNRFLTLVRREWMQHRRGWIVLLTLPFVLALVVALVGQVEIDLDPGDRGATQPLAAAAASLAVVAASTLFLAWGSALLMAPGLARRDVQDRSIEFWVSLPASHAESIGATLLSHLLLLPWAALAVGLAGGCVVAVAVVAKLFGAAALATLPWGLMLWLVVLVGLRVALGIVLASLWLSPLILGTMAASAWLKRWGVPVVIGLIAVAGGVLNAVYHNPIVSQTLTLLTTRARQALFAATQHDMVVRGNDDLTGLLQTAPGWLLHDAGAALSQAATPAFLAAIAVAVLAFGALWLRRQRGS